MAGLSGERPKTCSRSCWRARIKSLLDPAVSADPSAEWTAALEDVLRARLSPGWRGLLWIVHRISKPFSNLGRAWRRRDEPDAGTRSLRRGARIGLLSQDDTFPTGLTAQQVLLAAPLKITCREDCKGLCPHCGTNLNQEQCSCAVTPEEPRWAALKEIRGKLAH